MRKFSSYGSINANIHYYAPREALIEQGIAQLLGERPDEEGHYITVWGPRQRGKTWIMQHILFRLRQNWGEKFDVLKINLEHLKLTKDVDRVVYVIAKEIIEELALNNVTVNQLDDFYHIFKRGVLKKPLILIMDEFDALNREAISGIVGVFRNIYTRRQDDLDKATGEKSYLLHGAALIGVRAALGVENDSGSPFNVQRGLHIPNLTFEEVKGMFNWYEEESEQSIEADVIKRLFYETQGQPGLTCWLGELLTETYNHTPKASLTMDNFEEVFAAASKILPNSNILNIVSKARQEPHKQFVLELFRTDEKIPFEYDNPSTNHLYLNGVIDWERESKTNYYVKFSSPFVQKRLFSAFSYEIFKDVGRLHAPFENLGDTITETHLNVVNLVRRYEHHLKENRDWLLKDAPRRSTDLRIYEAVFHFSLYSYLSHFLRRRKGQVVPEFPTGNGQIDLIIRYSGLVYGLEVKSYTNSFGYQEALKQAARYGRQLKLTEITLVFFIEQIDKTNRNKYEALYQDQKTGVTVRPVFVEIEE